MMKKLKIPFRILNATLFSFKYLKNPFVIFEIPLKNTIEIILKNDEKIKINGKYLPHIIELLQKGWIFSNGYFIMENIRLN